MDRRKNEVKQQGADQRTNRLDHEGIRTREAPHRAPEQVKPRPDISCPLIQAGNPRMSPGSSTRRLTREEPDRRSPTFLNDKLAVGIHVIRGGVAPGDVRHLQAVQPRFQRIEAGAA